MAITDVYQDLIMNPENMPNRLQNLQRFSPVDNLPGRFDAFYDSTSNQEIPGFNFVDAPTSLVGRITNPEFLNNPRTGILDASILSRGNPQNSLFNRAKSGFTQGLEKAKDKIGSGLDLGRSAIGGILSLISGLPGVEAVLNSIKETPQQKALKDFYEATTGLTSTGQVASGVMEGYNPVSGFGPQGLTSAIGKRISRIEKTLKEKKSKILEDRLKELKELRQKEQQALERDRVSRARELNPGVYANLDRATGGKGYGDAGGFSTERAGKEGAFGAFDGSKGRKDFYIGGLAGLL